MPIVSIADAQIHYERAGTGRPLVLVHEGVSAPRRSRTRRWAWRAATR